MNSLRDHGSRLHKNHPAVVLFFCLELSILMKAGDVCIHPSNVPHGGQTKTGFKGIDIFCPPRPDHVDKLKAALKDKEEE